MYSDKSIRKEVCYMQIDWQWFKFWVGQRYFSSSSYPHWLSPGVDFKDA
jgi:hypothetical protein